MNRIDIEWRHLETDGETCQRCAETGATLREVVAAIAAQCRARDWEIRFTETRLGQDRIPESNLILVDGVPIEDRLGGARAGESFCESCCALVGRPTRCRTLEAAGRTYEAVPASLVRAAVCQVASCC